MNPGFVHHITEGNAQNVDFLGQRDADSGLYMYPWSSWSEFLKICAASLGLPPADVEWRAVPSMRRQELASAIRFAEQSDSPEIQMRE